MSNFKIIATNVYNLMTHYFPAYQISQKDEQE